MVSETFSTVLVGAGNMGGAMLFGWLENGIPAKSITVIDPSPRDDIRERLEASGVDLVAEAGEAGEVDVLLIAVKPQLMDKVLPGLATLMGENTVAVSVAAGTTISKLETDLGPGSIVRAMPNTPALLKRGITACCPNPKVTDVQKARVQQLLEANGKVEWIGEESLIDAVTAVSGSGPAYVFHLAECLAAAGVEQGLPEDVANRLARETIAGAGEMLSRLPEESSKLRENVTSPKGTTAAALSVFMEDEALKRLVSKAVAAARKRSEELS